MIAIIAVLTGGPAWTAQIFAEIEQTAMETIISSGKSGTLFGVKNPPEDWEWADNGGIGSFNKNAGWSLPKVWTCPSMPTQSRPATNGHPFSLENLVKGGYAANFGSDTFMSFADQSKAGIFGPVGIPTPPAVRRAIAFRSAPVGK